MCIYISVFYSFSHPVPQSFTAESLPWFVIDSSLWVLGIYRYWSRHFGCVACLWIHVSHGDTLEKATNQVPCVTYNWHCRLAPTITRITRKKIKSWLIVMKIRGCLVFMCRNEMMSIVAVFTCESVRYFLPDFYTNRVTWYKLRNVTIPTALLLSKIWSTGYAVCVFLINQLNVL